MRFRMSLYSKKTKFDEEIESWKVLVFQDAVIDFGSREVPDRKGKRGPAIHWKMERKIAPE